MSAATTLLKELVVIAIDELFRLLTRQRKPPPPERSTALPERDIQHIRAQERASIEASKRAERERDASKR
jgi:hypothetical protein